MLTIKFARVQIFAGGEQKMQAGCAVPPLDTSLSRLLTKITHFGPIRTFWFLPRGATAVRG